MNTKARRQRMDELRVAYINDPDFVGRHYEVPSLGDLVSLPGVVGVARFIEHVALMPERLFTFVYRAASIEISSVVGATELWESIGALQWLPDKNAWGVQEGEPFDPSQARHRSVVLELPSKACPKLLGNWASVRGASINAGSCSTEALDGVVYSHRLADREFRSDTDWYNPEPPEHEVQLAFVDAYEKLLLGVGLCPQFSDK